MKKKNVNIKKEDNKFKNAKEWKIGQKYLAYAQDFPENPWKWHHAQLQYYNFNLPYGKECFFCDVKLLDVVPPVQRTIPVTYIKEYDNNNENNIKE